MIYLLKMVIVQFTMLVYQRVSCFVVVYKIYIYSFLNYIPIKYVNKVINIMNAPHLFNRALLDISTWDIFISGESPCHGHENRAMK